VVRVGYNKNVGRLRELKVWKLGAEIWGKDNVTLRGCYWVRDEVGVASVDMTWSARILNELYLAADRIACCSEYENVCLVKAEIKPREAGWRKAVSCADELRALAVRGPTTIIDEEVFHPHCAGVVLGEVGPAIEVRADFARSERVLDYINHLGRADKQ
jgi:hypothetical protein